MSGSTSSREFRPVQAVVVMVMYLAGAAALSEGVERGRWEGWESGEDLETWRQAYQLLQNRIESCSTRFLS